MTGRFGRVLVVLLVAALLPYFLQLGASSIWDANEAYYVETPREMIESGDYLNPSFNYEPRFNKPVLTYWIVAGFYQVFGVSVGVQRLAIAGAAMLMVAGAFVIARAVSPHPLAPLLAALGLAAGPRFFMFSRRIFVDMAISAMMTLTLVFFVLAERHPARRRLFLVLMYVSVGLGVLTKGPVAAVLPALAFLAYLAVHRELGRLREMLIPTGTLIALAIVAPWYVLLYLEHGWTYITGFFIGENIGRFTDTVGVQARGPWFYLPVIVTDYLPWSLALPAVVVAWWREVRRKPDTTRIEPDATAARLRTLLLLWMAVIVGAFSASQTKQDLYIFPIAAAVTALGGDWVARALAGQARAGWPWLRGMLVTLSAVLALLGAFVLYVFGPSQTVYAIAGARGIGMLALVGGAAMAALAWRGQGQGAVAAGLAVFVGFNWLLVLQALPSFERYKPVVPLSQVIAREAGPDAVVAHFDVALPSMVFYLRRHIDVWVDPEAFVAQVRAGRPVYAVLPADRYEQLKPEFGVPTCELARHPTSDIRLRRLLEMEAPPEVVLMTTRCGA